jgi:ATP-dependent Clp protease ATP-binding subunit ClpB
MKTRVLNLLRQNFRPEFLNRVDEIIVFHALEPAEIEKIAALLLEKTGGPVPPDHPGPAGMDDKALSYIAENGYDPAYGARPLKRLIQQEVETLLSRKIVSGEVKPEEPGADYSQC